MSITRRLKVLRAERDMTQRDVASAAGMPMLRYWEIENGHRVPTSIERRRIAKALGSTVAALSFTDTPEAEEVR